MTGDSTSLKSYLCESLLNYITDPSHSLDEESKSQLYKLLFSLIKENNNIIIGMVHSEVTSNERAQIAQLIKKLLNTLSTVIDSDRTILRDSKRHGESDIYDPTTKFLKRIYSEMTSCRFDCFYSSYSP